MQSLRESDIWAWPPPGGSQVQAWRAGKLTGPPASPGAFEYETRLANSYGAAHKSALRALARLQPPEDLEPSPPDGGASPGPPGSV